MNRKLVKSQLNNWSTYMMYFRQGLTLAENVFKFDKLPKYIDESYMNSCLVRKGAIAFFFDEVIDEILALPFVNTGKLDVYGRPTAIQVFSQNGYTKWLKEGEFVIMYDNQGHFPIYLDIQQYARRIAEQTRVMDINIAQQRTPRFWKVPQDKLKTIKDIANNIDGDIETILAYSDLEIEDMNIVLEPAPYVADKIRDEKSETWNELLRYIGISNLSYQKKERMISDEVSKMQGGTIAMRESRYEARKRAIDRINEKFNLDMKVKFYDGVPSSTDIFNPDAYNIVFGGDDNDKSIL